jgi:hypothetical protein
VKSVGTLKDGNGWDGGGGFCIESSSYGLFIGGGIFVVMRGLVYTKMKASSWLSVF